MAPLAEVQELQARVHAIEHATRSLALARVYLSVEIAPQVPNPCPVGARLRAEVSRVARMLEEVSGPTGHSPRALEGAAEGLDRELHALRWGAASHPAP
jgi:hypothetical protein